ncbi:MAG TPA: O-methyltransferase [Saprospiraceae bacterium]|nr:O-methyltransferase [Saprospiraceae bacterium]
MNINSEAIHQYCEQHSSPQSSLLTALERETHLKTILPNMLSGHLQGAFLGMLSQLIKPMQILEVGTFTGYSGICLATGLHPDGVLHTIEFNPEMEEMIIKYISQSPQASQIKVHIGNALEVIKTLAGPFDMVFIDAAKTEYSAYYDLVFDKLNIGGLIIADNVLWSGKVLEEKKDKDTIAIDAFNKKMNTDNRIEHLIVPLRDGLHLIRKISN